MLFDLAMSILAKATHRCLRPRMALAAIAVVIVAFDATHAPAQTAEGTAAWRVECSGDGKTLDCRAVQQIFQRNAQQQVAPLATVLIRHVPEAKTAQLSIQLPLGLNLTEPILVKVDNGQPERQPIQVCNNAGCFATM